MIAITGRTNNTRKYAPHEYESGYAHRASRIGNQYYRYDLNGEVWIEKAAAVSALDVPYRFTGKERDKETGLYYYGARYLDPKDSRWLSVDPAMGEYVPVAPV
jgi:RHS repeat-associated protein